MKNHYHDIEVHEAYVTAEKVRNAFLGITSRQQTLLELFRSHNEDVKKLVGISKSAATYAKYDRCMRRLEEFMQTKYRIKDIALKEISHVFITDFENYLRTESGCTDKAIRLERLESGNKYDNLYYATKARSEADWLVGINSTQAITLAAGRSTYSLGRVQTPALAMVCSRFWENKRFTPEDVFQAHFSTLGSEADTVVKLSSAEKWKEKAATTVAYRSLKEQGAATLPKSNARRPCWKRPCCTT